MAASIALERPQGKNANPVPIQACCWWYGWPVLARHRGAQRCALRVAKGDSGISRTCVRGREARSPYCCPILDKKSARLSKNERDPCHKICDASSATRIDYVRQWVDHNFSVVARGGTAVASPLSARGGEATNAMSKVFAQTDRKRLAALQCPEWSLLPALLGGDLRGRRVAASGRAPRRRQWSSGFEKAH